MTKKRSPKNTHIIATTLADTDNEDDQPAPQASQTKSQLTSASAEVAQINSSASPFTGVNLNGSDMNIDMSTQTSSLDKRSVNPNLSSKVWLYATKFTDHDSDSQQASCHLCDYTCSCNSHSTSTIRQHLISKHSKADLVIEKQNSSKSKMSEALKQKLHQLCYAAIVKDSRSFNDLNKSGIKAVFKKLCPDYTPPHRNQVSRQLGVLYKHHYDLLVDELKQVRSLSITLDFWSNHRCQSFLCITGHWVSDKWETISKIINFSVYTNRHTAIEIAETLEAKLIALGILDKIICITCDGAKNMKLVCEYLSDDIPRLWCCAHRLHLVVINGLSFWMRNEKLNEISKQNSSTNYSTINRSTTADSNASISNKNNTNINWDEELNDKAWLVNKSSSKNTTNETEVVVGLETITDDDDNDDDYENLDDLIEDNWTTGFQADGNPTEYQKCIMKLLIKCRAVAKITKKPYIISEFIRNERQLTDQYATIRIDFPDPLRPVRFLTRPARPVGTASLPRPVP
ncbi:unnamed protein product, partial [Adineta ricciae]